MAWIESHQALAHHPKTLRLASGLKCTVPTAIGYVHLLWYWALDYAQDGEIDGSMRDQVARACMWHGKTVNFWTALLHAGFIEPSERGVRIHDWTEYAGRLLERRRADADRKRAVRRNSGARPSDTPQDVRRTVPNQPDRTGQTGPDPTPPTPPSDPPKGGDWCCVGARISNGQQHVAQCSASVRA